MPTLQLAPLQPVQPLPPPPPLAQPAEPAPLQMAPAPVEIICPQGQVWLLAEGRCGVPVLQIAPVQPLQPVQPLPPPPPPPPIVQPVEPAPLQVVPAPVEVICPQGQVWLSAEGRCGVPVFQVVPARPVQPAPQIVGPLQPRPLAGSAWAGRIVPLVDSLVARLEARMNGLRLRSEQVQAGAMGQIVPVTPDILSAAGPPAIAGLDLEGQYRSVLDRAIAQPRNLHLPPQIQSVLTTPVAGLLEPGSAVLITGSNFGNSPGRVYLTYTVGRETPGTEFQAAPGQRYSVELEPYHAAWSQSWFSNVIMARVVTTYAAANDAFLVADRPGEIVVVLPDGATATAGVVVAGGFPQIQSIQTVRGDGRVKPGERFVVLGRNFGAATGAAVFDIRGETQKRWQRIRGTDRYIFWTPFGEANEPPTLGKYGLSIVSWSDNRIELQAGDYFAGTYFGGGTAILEIYRSDRKLALGRIWYGPDIERKTVSGLQWLEASSRQAARPQHPAGAMIITHTPTCEFLSDSGERGVDRFFADAPWPADVEVVAFDFREIDPDDPYTDLDFFVDQMSDLVDAAFSGPVGFAKYVGGKLLDAVFGGGGGYHAYVRSAPGGYFWDNNPHIIVIDWETDCALDGKPIMYAVSFTIAGTRAALARY